jgi:hypothetical protein
VGLLVLALTGLAEPAAACSTPGPDFQVTETGGGEAPDQPRDIHYSIKRGQAPQNKGCSVESSSCDDIGSIELEFPTPGDADSTADEIGYEVTVVAGTLPDGAALSNLPRAGFRDSGQASPTRVWLHWADGASDEQESLDLTVTITAVDRDGNRSPASEPVRISDAAGEGCTVHRVSQRRALDLSWLLLGASCCGSPAACNMVVSKYVRDGRWRMPSTQGHTADFDARPSPGAPASTASGEWSPSR